MSLPQIDSITAAVDAVRQRIRVVSTESVDLGACAGRVLAERVTAFRDSPAVDVSAMDGYALRRCDARDSAIPVRGTASAGAEPLQCPAGQAVRIFTGGAVPEGADCVIPREQCVESPLHIELRVPVDSLRSGQNIRRRGENSRRGATLLEPGTLIGGPGASVLVSLCDSDQISVHRPVRVAIINTGDELVEPGQPIRDWQIRDSNGPLLAAMLSCVPWVQWHRQKVPDAPEQIRLALARALVDSDAVILTGGVSMGDTDHVPKSVVDCGGEIVFHRIAIRPGKPLLGAVGPQGQLVMGLPGNPVSVAVTFRRYAIGLLRHMAGVRPSEETVVRVSVAAPDSKTLDLVWFRLVQLDGAGAANLLPNQGSGDIVSLAHSDGFVEIPPGRLSQGSFPYYPW